MDYILANWQQVLVWTSAASLFAVLLTLAGVPWVVGRLPADYFMRRRRSACATPQARNSAQSNPAGRAGRTTNENVTQCYKTEVLQYVTKVQKVTKRQLESKK